MFWKAKKYLTWGYSSGLIYFGENNCGWIWCKEQFQDGFDSLRDLLKIKGGKQNKI